MHPSLAASLTLLATLLATLSCSGEAPRETLAPRTDMAAATRSPSADASASAATSRATPPEDPAIRARLDQEPLAGLVIAHPRALYFPTAEAARTAARAFGSEPRGPEDDGSIDGAALRVIEDLGAVVKVVTDVSERGFATLDGRFSFELFVRREALLPVLRAPHRARFTDGTALLLREGATIAPRADGPRPIRNLLADALGSSTIAPDQITLSFTVMAGAPPIDSLDPAQAGPTLGCDFKATDDALTVRVAPHEALMEEKQEAERKKHRAEGTSSWTLGSRGGPSFPCMLVSDPTSFSGVRDADLTMNGKAITTASGAQLERCFGEVAARAVEGAEGRAFVTFSLPRATLRVITDTRALVKAGGCGAGAFGGLSRPQVKAVKRGATAYFPGGAKAGTHTATSTKLSMLGVEAAAQEGRTCVRPAYLSVPLCFDDADLTLE